MNISQILSTGTSSTTSNKTTTQAAATAAANPITASINKFTAKLQTQLDTATANLSTLGKFKASVSAVQASASSLTTLKDSSTSDEMKKALTAFISDFNSMVTSTKTAATDTSGVNTISRGMTRAMTADFSRVDALRQMGFTKASDGSLELDTAKFEAAFKASPSSVQSTLSKLGQMVNKAATKELASDGRISNSMSALNSKSSLLQIQQSALQKAAQQYANLSTTSVSSALNFYQSGE
jgi:hypothetical protein